MHSTMAGSFKRILVGTTRQWCAGHPGASMLALAAAGQGCVTACVMWFHASLAEQHHSMSLFLGLNICLNALWFAHDMTDTANW